MSIFEWLIENWKIGSFLGISAITVCTGGILTLSNVGEDSTTHLFRSVPDTDKPYSKTWAEMMDGKEFHDTPIVRHPYAKLLRGDSRYNNGNYIIYYGSAACIHCTEFLFNDQTIAYGKTSRSQNQMSRGVWMRAFQFTKDDPVLSQYNIKFLMYDDMPDKNMVDKNDSYWTLPWAMETNSSSGGTPQYKRNDRSAKEIRKIIDTAQDIFGQEKVPGTPTVIVYKNGQPKVFNRDTLKGLEKEEKQDEGLSNQSQLIRFIKHYYTYKPR